MGLFGIPSEISALQSTHAQGVASKAKAAQRAATERSRRREDDVEFKVDGMEDGAAIRKADEDANEDEASQRRREDAAKEQPAKRTPLQGEGLDLTA